MIGVGDMVVCIEDFITQDQKPKVGMVYTVRGYEKFLECANPGIWLEEIIRVKRKTISGYLEPNWDITGFKPVKKTSIDVFKKMCVKPPKELVYVT